MTDRGDWIWYDRSLRGSTLLFSPFGRGFLQLLTAAGHPADKISLDDNGVTGPD